MIVFLIGDDKLFRKKQSDAWKKVSNSSKMNLIVNPSTIKRF